MTGALPSKKLVVAHGRPTANSAKGGMNIQMGLTIGGVALLLCLTLIGCAFGRKIFGHDERTDGIVADVPQDTR